MGEVCDLESEFLSLSPDCQAKYTARVFENLDDFFLITNGMIVFFMQCGFAFLEAGAVRSKNTTNILIKNVVDAAICGIAYWIIGYPLAFGDDEDFQGKFFLGRRHWASYNLPPTKYSFWFFQFVFAATTSTIISGAVAERCEFSAYLVYSTAVTGFIYPIVSHWVWSDYGWLNVGASYELDGVTREIGYLDFAGSGVVHVTGGVAAFVAAAILGPRIGRFRRREYLEDERDERYSPIEGHSIPLAALGGLILMFGFFAFNGGSQLSITKPDDGAVVAKAVVNTVISGCFAAFTGLVLNRIHFVGGYWSLLATINAFLTGMVAICAGCNTFQPWCAAVTGGVAGIAFISWSRIIVMLRIDDPLDAIALHAGGGLWGVISVALFNEENGIVYHWNRASGLQMAWQLAGVAAIVGWTVILSLIVFGCLHLAGILRVSPEIEQNGLDVAKHNEPAYPENLLRQPDSERAALALAHFQNLNEGQLPARNGQHPHQHLHQHLHQHPHPHHQQRQQGAGQAHDNNGFDDGVARAIVR